MVRYKSAHVPAWPVVWHRTKHTWNDHSVWAFRLISWRAEAVWLEEETSLMLKLKLELRNSPENANHRKLLLLDLPREIRLSHIITSLLGCNNPAYAPAEKAFSIIALGNICTSLRKLCTRFLRRFAYTLSTIMHTGVITGSLSHISNQSSVWQAPIYPKSKSIVVMRAQDFLSDALWSERCVQRLKTCLYLQVLLVLEFQLTKTSWASSARIQKLHGSNPPWAIQTARFGISDLPLLGCRSCT